MTQDNQKHTQVSQAPVNSAQQTMYGYMDDDEIDLRELFATVWKGKWIIIGVTLIFSVAAVLFALSKPNIYKADALLAPAQSSGGSSLSKMASQFGGLASLAGINLGGGGSNETDLAVQVLKSRQFASFFIQKHDLLVPLMAIKEWDASSNELLINDALYNAQTHEWLREAKGLRTAQPSMQEAFDVFSQQVSVELGQDSGLYSLSVKHFSPYIAQQWVNWLIEDINNMMRERSIAESTQNLRYLEEQLQKTAVADMQSTFYSLIEEQTKSLMLAEVQEEYVFKIVDPAVAPELNAEPKRALICVLGTLLGGMLGVFGVLVLAFMRKEETPEDKK